MSQRSHPEHDAVANDVTSLLKLRETVQSWLARLDANHDLANERVRARVREDYERRLAETLQALAAHHETIRAQLRDAEDRLRSAEQEREDAADALEEARLRNLIGELSDTDWEGRREILVGDVAAVTEREEGERAEARRLRELLEQLDSEGGSTVESFVEPEVQSVERAPAMVGDPSPSAGDAGDALGQLEKASAVNGAELDDDLEPRLPLDDPREPEIEDGFLSEIDRALDGAEAEKSAPQPMLEDGLEEEIADTAPKPGLKCSECGYTNDLGAWYCGVCGADVGVG